MIKGIRMKKCIIFIILLLLFSVNISSETGFLTANLKIRNIPSLTGTTITILQKNSQIEIIARTKFKETIDGLFDYWLKIENNNTTGWVYAGYVELNGKSKLFLEEDDVVIIDNKLIQTSTITEKEEYTDRLGDYARALTQIYLQDLKYPEIIESLGPFEEEIKEYPQESRHGDGTYNLYVTTLKSDELIIEYYNIENKKRFLSSLTILSEQFDDPWNLGFGHDLIEYIRLFGIGKRVEDSYIFDVDSLDDWVGFSGVEDFILTLDSNDKIRSITIKKYTAID
jgi:hypothetical protein